MAGAPLSDNVRGALWMTASMAGFILNDALMKAVSADLPLFQAIFLRGLMATAVIGALAWSLGALNRLPRGRDGRLIGWRMMGEIGGTSLYLAALFNMPIANATAISQVTPLTVTLAAALFLGHAIGWRTYAAIAVGFAGVLLIVRPGSEGFNVFSLAVLASVGFVTLRDMTARGLSAQVPNLLVTVASSVSITVFAGVIAALEPWQPTGAGTLLRLGGAAGLLLLGYYAGVVSMRVGDIGFVSPFRYSNLLWALALGWAFFGDVPSWLTVAGAAIIVATGAYTLHRERLTARLATPRGVPPPRPAEASGACPGAEPPAGAARPGPR